MNRLFYVTAYSARLNDWHRVMLTAASAEAARERVASTLPDGWQVKRDQFICETPEQVFEEL